MPQIEDFSSRGGVPDPHPIAIVPGHQAVSVRAPGEPSQRRALGRKRTNLRSREGIQDLKLTIILLSRFRVSAKRFPSGLQVTGQTASPRLRFFSPAISHTLTVSLFPAANRLPLGLQAAD